MALPWDQARPPSGWQVTSLILTGLSESTSSDLDFGCLKTLLLILRLSADSPDLGVPQTSATDSTEQAGDPLLHSPPKRTQSGARPCSCPSQSRREVPCFD